MSKIFVVPRGDSWAVRREGEANDVSTHFTRAEAEDAGRNLSRRDQCDLEVRDTERRSRPRETAQPAFVTAS
jgi:hypothetical protein